jgi:hypothetical protein
MAMLPRRLPLELLEYIFNLVDHPGDLVVLAATTNFFRALLSDLAYDPVFIELRVGFQPLPIPAPPQGYTEFRWASKIFGSSECLVAVLISPHQLI